MSLYRKSKNKLQVNSIFLQNPFWEWQVYQKNSFPLLSSLPFSYRLFYYELAFNVFLFSKPPNCVYYLSYSKSTFAQWQLKCSHYNYNYSTIKSLLHHKAKNECILLQRLSEQWLTLQIKQCVSWKNVIKSKKWMMAFVYGKPIWFLLKNIYI